MRIRSWDQHGLRTNFSLLEDRYIIWTQIQISYSLISATIPSVRRLIITFSTHWGAGVGPSGLASWESANRQGSTIVLTDIKSQDKTTRNASVGQHPMFMYGGQSETQVYGRRRNTNGDSDDDEIRLGSSDDTQMIIRKDVNVTVENSHDVP